MMNFNVDSFHVQPNKRGTLFDLILFQGSNVVGECEFIDENKARNAGLAAKRNGVHIAYEMADEE